MIGTFDPRLHHQLLLYRFQTLDYVAVVMNYVQSPTDPTFVNP